MPFRALLLAFALLSCLLPGSPGRAAERPTKFEPIDRSLSELLGDGWQVTALSHDIGMQFILHKEGGYVYCLLRSLSSLSGTQASSDCYRLN